MTNANKFISPTINVAALPVPNAIEEIDAEAIIAARMASFQEFADAAGFPYDVGGLETDPIKIDQEAHAYRETLLRSRVNSAVRAVLPAYAQGADLDAIVARANVQRLVLVEAEDNPPDNVPIMETDRALLLRYLTTYGRPAAGSDDGIITRVLEAAPALWDVLPAGPKFHGMAGHVTIYLLTEGGITTPVDTIDRVRDALEKPDAMPITDVWNVAAALLHPYAATLRVTVPPGPIHAEVAAAAKAAVERVVAARYAIGADVWLSVLAGAAYVANVERVEVLSPAADIITDYRTAPFCTGVTIQVVTAEL